MNDLMRPALYGAKHKIIPLKKSKSINSIKHDFALFDFFGNYEYFEKDYDKSLIYKKSPYEYEEFSIKYEKGKFICCVPLKIGVQYRTKFTDYFYAHEYITNHLEYYET